MAPENTDPGTSKRGTQGTNPAAPKQVPKSTKSTTPKRAPSGANANQPSCCAAALTKAVPLLPTTPIVAEMLASTIKIEFHQMAPAIPYAIVGDLALCLLGSTQPILKMEVLVPKGKEIEVATLLKKSPTFQDSSPPRLCYLKGGRGRDDYEVLIDDEEIAPFLFHPENQSGFKSVAFKRLGPGSVRVVKPALLLNEVCHIWRIPGHRGREKGDLERDIFLLEHMKSNDIQTTHAELDGIGPGLVKRLNVVNDKAMSLFLDILLERDN